MATAITIRINPEDVDLSQVGKVELDNAASEIGQDNFEHLRDDHPAQVAWDQLLEDVIREVEPQAKQLLLDAVHARLPWTWEPER